MSVNDAPAGGTGGPSGEPTPIPDLPEKMRVHALAKLLGRPSKDVLGTLSALGHEVRSVQSNIIRATAEQVAAALAPAAAGAGGPQQSGVSAEPAPSGAEPDPGLGDAQAPVDAPEPAEAETGTGTAAPAAPSGGAPARHDPFAGNTAGQGAAGAPAETSSAGLAPVFAVPMFQAPTAPAAPARPAAPSAGAGEGDDTTSADGGGRSGRKGRRRRRDEDPASTEPATGGSGEEPQAGSGQPAAAADTAEGETATGGSDTRAGTSRDSTTRDSTTRDSEARDASGEHGAEGDDSAEGYDDGDDSDDEGSSRRRRRRGRRGRGRGKGGDEQDCDAGEDSGDTGDTDSGGSDGSDESGSDETDGDSGDDEQSSAGSRRRRRRRRRGGSDVDERSEDDPPNTVTKVREARAESTDDGVQGVRGSTRLEAKRQRRRDGRDAGRRRPPILSEAEFLARRESVDRQMVIRQLADRTEIGVLEDDVLVEHFITGGGTGSASMVGNIYLGRVQNVLPSMEAAFVDIGRGRNAVLYAGEVNWDAAGLNGKARKIEQALSSGDQVLVQVTKDPVGHKGARLTTQISLAGRFLVYVPSGGAAGISRKLPDTERKRLKEMLKEIVPSEAGVIIRTASEGVSHEALERDVRRLQAQWEVVKEKSQKTGPGAPKAPTLLYEEPDMLVKVVRDQFNEDFSKLIVSGADAWDTVSGYVEHVAPELVDRMHRHTGPSDVFTEYRIDEQLLKALDRKVWLPSGGTLVIDRTEAMTVVDVNTGKFTGSGGNLEETVTRNNLEAAEEVVRQLRLRDIGGIIVVDFIDMVLEANRDLVLRRLTECLARDRTRHQVAEVTSLGLVQMTRKRVGGGLLEHFSTQCEHCRGRGVIVSTDPAADHSHGGNGRGNGNGDGNNGNGNGSNGSQGSDGGGRRRRRRGNGGDSGANGGGNTGADRSGSDRSGSEHSGSQHSGSERNGHADRPVDTTSAVAGVAAVAAGRSAKGDEAATAGSPAADAPAPAGNAPAAGAGKPGAPAPAAADNAAPAAADNAVPAAADNAAPAAADGAAPAAAEETVPATADSTVLDAAPAPEPGGDPDTGTAVAEPVGELTGTAAPGSGTTASGTATPAPGTVDRAPSGSTGPAPDAPAGTAAAGTGATTGTAPTGSAPSGATQPGGAGAATTPDTPAATTPDTPAAPAPRRRRVSRSAGSPQRGVDPVVITTSAAGETTPAASRDEVAGPAGGAAPAVPAQPEPAASRPRRPRRAASRPAGPPQDGG
ncbi:ribonuclease E [Pseudonocardia ammonioxydans]|uniref:Ribonuclease E n=1 Tax=Pseudonocardia ammonioxydans TaxID=260086 RepID=A0A1I5E616_PSUAM|nr:translation initiation factor IF-2 N-terminal domain-containing protein [Pseudonocardia ammonioxydans]SFO06710.1 ribonuclease E [Pseudonocardia ammonioxydans]